MKMQNLIKDRPIIFFDLETTGVNLLTDRIVEISVLKIFPDGTREVRTRRLNPEMHIPEEASAVHGIYDADVANEPTFRRVSKNLYIFFEDCDLGGYNILKFDIPMLTREFARSGLTFTTSGRRIVDAYNIFCRMEPRTLSAAYKFFCGKEMKDAHSAEADTLATYEIFEGEMQKYSRYTPDQLPEEVEKFPDNLDELHRFCNQNQMTAIDPEGRFRWKENEAVVAFGRNAGTPLRKIAVENPDFLRWIIRSDFSPEVKKIASDALKGEFPVKGN
ncbi:MAG: 3'-5' exonuclease [Lentisphaeria bacterium]|nr:3'-5' exonuclease [Lentisphaeria bacterium]